MKPTRSAGRIALLFALLSALWIVVSDVVVGALSASDASLLQGLQLLKGGIFVLISSVTLFLVIQWFLKRQYRFTTARDEILQDERREIGRVVARTLVHDVRNIMSILRSNIDFLRMTHDDPTSNEALDDLEEALADLNSLVNHLRESSMTTTELSEIDIVDSLRLCARVVRSDRRFQDVTLHTDSLYESLKIIGHPVLLRQAVLNIFVNAAEAGADHIWVRCRREDDAAVVTISDDGPGMDDETMRRAFEPFFSTKNRGSGLGLVSVKQTVDFHGGAIALSESDAGGLEVSFSFPAVDGRAIEDH